jgi:hypothetical protein
MKWEITFGVILVIIFAVFSIFTNIWNALSIVVVLLFVIGALGGFLYLVFLFLIIVRRRRYNEKRNEAGEKGSFSKLTKKEPFNYRDRGYGGGRDFIRGGGGRGRGISEDNGTFAEEKRRTLLGFRELGTETTEHKSAIPTDSEESGRDKSSIIESIRRDIVGDGEIKKSSKPDWFTPV